MSDTDNRESIAQLSQSLERTLTQNRSLFEEMTRFSRDESLRLAHAQLDRANQAFSHIRARHDLSSLIGVQQEWLRQTIQDYASLSLRYAEMFHALAQHVQSHVKHAGSDLRHQAENMAEDQMQMGTPHNGVHVEHPHMPAE